MKDDQRRRLAFDEWDEAHFPRPEGTDYDGVADRAISRRGFLGGVRALGSGADVGSCAPG